MTARRSTAALVVAALVLVALSAHAGGKLRGWVTRVDQRAQTMQVDEIAVPLAGLRVTGGALEPGVFVKVDKGRIKVKPQRPPADDEVVRYPPKDAQNPGRVEFSHLRHFNALGEKQCKTCHSAGMKLVTDGSPEGRQAPATSEPHGAASKGRFCGSCHDGAAAGRAGGRAFTTARTDTPASCERCHAPADHGRDFTARHGDIAEDGRGTTCATCHRQDCDTRGG